MDEEQALLAFAALSQQTRLRVLRALVIAGPEGRTAGDIAGLAGVSPSNISFHLKEIERAGLVSARRSSRTVVYSARFDALAALVSFLVTDCCAGHPSICSPLASACLPTA